MNTELEPFISALINTKATFMIVVPENANPRLKFEMTFSLRQRTIVNLVQQYFACGSIVQRRSRVYGDRPINGSLTYTVTKRESLRTVIDFCDRTELFDEAREAFGEFRMAFDVIESGQHITPEGFRRVLDIKRGRDERWNRPIETGEQNEEN